MATDLYPRLPISRPHTSVQVDTSGIGGSAGSSEKILCLIGKADGGAPNTVYSIRNYSQAKRIFRGGELLDAIELAWNSNPLYSAGKILAMRVDDATVSTLTKDGLKMTSQIYGADANNIQVALENNTLTDSLRVRIIFDNDRINQVYDNIGNIFSLTYTGAGASASYTVTVDSVSKKATKLTLNVAGSPAKEYDLSAGMYTYINDVIRDINQLPDFKAVASPYGDKNILSSGLDSASAVDVKTKTANVKAVMADLLKQTAYNGYVTFERNGTGNITAFAPTKLTGGTNGEAPVSWANKLEKFAYEGGYYLVPLSDKQSVHAEVGQFVKSRSDAGEPMRAIVGGGIAETKEQLLSRVASLYNPRVSLIANSGTFAMDNGRLLKVPAYMVASAVAGLASGLDIGDSITFKHLRIAELDTVYDSGELDQLNENGIIAVEFVRNRTETSFRIVDDVTTYNDKSDPVKQEMAVGEANDFLVSELKVQLDDAFIGSRTINTSASIIKDFIISYLGRKKRDNEIQDFSAEDVQVIIEGSEARISMTIYPIRSLKKIAVSLVYRQQVLQA